MDMQHPFKWPSGIAAAFHEPLVDEIADLEAYARLGTRPPPCRGYLIRVNRAYFVVHQRCISGRELLRCAGMSPAEHYVLRAQTAGGHTRTIEPDDQVDLRQPALVRFKAFPCDRVRSRA